MSRSYDSPPVVYLQDILRHLPVAMPNVHFLSQFFAMDIAKEMKNLCHTPLLHIHGMQDNSVKIEHAKEYEEARKGLGDSRFIRLPKSDHDFSCVEERTLAIQETSQWFANTLSI